MFRVFGLEVEVATDHGGGQARYDIEGLARIRARARCTRVLASLFVKAAQRLDLHSTLKGGVVLEVCGDDAQRPTWSVEHGFQREPLHAGDAGIGRPREQMREDLQDTALR